MNRAAPLIYVLPVEQRGEARYGDPRRLLAEAQAAERLGAMFAFPEFDETPWFADHRFRNDLICPHAWDLAWLWPLLTELLAVYRGRSESQS